ncbi:unnamed protein product [Amaranthus hypochondriacus]
MMMLHYHFSGMKTKRDIQKLEQYLPLLENFIRQVDSIIRNKSLLILELRIQWSSTLSTKFLIGGPKHFQINSLQYELAMILFFYGITTRQRAFEVFSEDMQQAASLLKKAAGIYKYLNAEVLPLLQSILPPEKPPETTINVSSAMVNFCLAEAQVVAIKIAEKQGLSNGVLAKLHYGVTQMLVEANSLLQSGPRDISRRFTEFIYSCSTLHELRSHIHLAESYRESEQLGVSIGLLNRALSKAKNIPGEQSWRQVYKTELNKVLDMLKKYKDENAFVWQQKIPLEFELPPLEGRLIVNVTPYEPQRWERVIAFST